jgi:hypothetical protein
MEARCKIRDRSCLAIEPKFLPMDFLKLMSHYASVDLGSMVLAQQIMLDKFCTWCQQWPTSSTCPSLLISTTTWLLRVLHAWTYFLGPMPFLSRLC